MYQMFQPPPISHHFPVVHIELNIITIIILFFFSLLYKIPVVIISNVCSCMSHCLLLSHDL